MAAGLQCECKAKRCRLQSAKEVLAVYATVHVRIPTSAYCAAPDYAHLNITTAAEASGNNTVTLHAPLLSCNSRDIVSIAIAIGSYNPFYVRPRERSCLHPHTHTQQHTYTHVMHTLTICVVFADSRK
jgi:hypothetical protein